ncbi:MAG: glycosyltransferase [Solirubrobacteraceae bacterium]
MGADRVTVVVPTRNSGRTIRSCLEHVRRQTHSNVELMVVDNGSRDETVAIAGEMADRVESHGAERSAQRNRGYELSTGDLIAFIDSDKLLEPEVLAEAVAAAGAEPATGGLVIPELTLGVGFLTGCRALEKRLYLGDARVEAAVIFTRAALERVGGYDESLFAGEDWELDDRVRAAGFAVGRTRALAWHDEGRVRLRAAFAKKRCYGRSLADYYRSGATTRPITRTALFSDPTTLAREPAHAAGMFLLKAVETAGLALGALEAGRAGRRSPDRRDRDIPSGSPD